MAVFGVGFSVSKRDGDWGAGFDKGGVFLFWFFAFFVMLFFGFLFGWF